MAKVMPTATVMVMSPPWSVDVMTVVGRAGGVDMMNERWQQHEGWMGEDQQVCEITSESTPVQVRSNVSSYIQSRLARGIEIRIHVGFSGRACIST